MARRWRRRGGRRLRDCLVTGRLVASGLFVALLFTMMFDDASRSGAGHRVVPGNMSNHPAHGGALQTAFGFTDSGCSKANRSRQNHRGHCVHRLPLSGPSRRTQSQVQSCNFIALFYRGKANQK